MTSERKMMSRDVFQKICKKFLALDRKCFFLNVKILGALECTVSIKKLSRYGVYLRPILGGEKRRESGVANQRGEKLFIDRAWS